MKYELKSYSFLQTIGKGMNLFLDNFLLLIVLSLILNTPLVVWNFFFHNAADLQFAGVSKLLTIGQRLLGAIVTQLISGLSILVIADKYLGNKTSLKEILFKGQFLFLPLLGQGLLLGVVYVCPFVVSALATLVHPMLSAVLTIVGYIILLSLFLGWFVAPHVLVLEGCSIKKSLSRSWDLTNGYKGWIFGFVFVSGIFNFVFTSLVDLFTNRISLLGVDQFVLSVLDYSKNVILASLIACINIVIYFNLKIEKEAFNVEHMANQFEKV